jgi:hypothetical protein
MFALNVLCCVHMRARAPRRTSERACESRELAHQVGSLTWLNNTVPSAPAARINSSTPPG